MSKTLLYILHVVCCFNAVNGCFTIIMQSSNLNNARDNLSPFEKKSCCLKVTFSTQSCSSYQTVTALTFCLSVSVCSENDNTFNLWNKIFRFKRLNSFILTPCYVMLGLSIALNITMVCYCVYILQPTQLYKITLRLLLNPHARHWNNSFIYLV